MAKKSGRKKRGHTKRGWRQDQKRRSKEGWERGRGAPKKGNPRYRPGFTINKRGSIQKVYRVRDDGPSFWERILGFFYGG